MSMFKQNDDTPMSNQAETTIGPSVKVEGQLNAVGNVIVEGIVEGSLSTDKDLTAGAQSQIIADVVAKNANIAGKIKGTLQIDGHLHLLATAQISGDIKTKTIQIEAGAQVNGQLTMGGSQTAPKEKGEKE